MNRFPFRQSSDSPENPNSVTADKNTDNSVRVLMYLFPRQFSLHNAFTSEVDHSRTAQRFQDYTLREEEIFNKLRKAKEAGQSLNVHVPKRLRGKVQDLVRHLQILHGRCSYAKMMQHYCPVPQHNGGETAASQVGKAARKLIKGRRKSRQATATQEPPKYSSLTELATPVSKVSAFCQAILTKIIPHEFWGKEAVQTHNLTTFMKNVDRFVKLRRFETMSLHELMRGLKVCFFCQANSKKNTLN